MGARKVVRNGKLVGVLHLAEPPFAHKTLCGRDRRRKLVPVALLADIPPERLCGQCALRRTGH